MLDRKAKLILSALILVMLGSAIWRVAHAARWSMTPFVIPACVLILAGVCVPLERKMAGSADALAAWKKWYSFFLISCTAILTAFQLLPVFHRLGIPLPSSELLFRLLIAGYGLVVVVTGNQKPKLPPLDSRPGMLSLGKAEQGAMLRLEGWLLVGFGLVTTVGALLLPIYLVAPVMGSLALAMLAAILVKRRQLREQH
jgi:hypothetical protein